MNTLKSSASFSALFADAFTAALNLPIIWPRPKRGVPLASLLHHLLLSAFLITPIVAQGQTLERIDPLSTAFAGSTTARSGDPRLASRNPASLGNLERRFNIFASFTPSVLGIEGYREGSFVAALSLGENFSFGLSGAGLGAGDYQEFSGGITGATTLGNDLRLGVTFTAQSTSIDDYGSQVVPVVDIGAQVGIADGLSLGASFVNATRTTVADEEIPQRLAMGMTYAPDSTFSLSFDVAQELRHDLAFGIGIGFKPIKDLWLRAGLSSAPGTVGYGIGYRIGDIRIDYGGAYLDPLGFRHVFGVGVAW